MPSDEEEEAQVTGPTPPSEAPERLRAALEARDSSARLQAAMAAGTRPDPVYVDVLVARCAVEPDFFVRDMLTWALIRHPAEVTVPILLEEVRDGVAQARSQALHTLTKIRDPRGWTVVTPELLQDADDRVARAAWRAAVLLAPAADRAGVAAALATQLGRGDREMWKSLGRAFVDLGDAAAAPLAEAATQGEAAVRLHAIATQRFVRDPDAGFDAAVFEAEHVLVLADARSRPPRTHDDSAD